jgi:hypothetical protein
MRSRKSRLHISTTALMSGLVVLKPSNGNAAVIG